MQRQAADDIAAFVTADSRRWAILEAVRRQRLPDWAIGAGFIRSPVWDALHGYTEPTPLADVDVLFFAAEEVSRDREGAIEAALREAMPEVPWSVRNQARMHRRNGDVPYADTADALRFWLETPTAVAIRIAEGGRTTLLAPFGVADLLGMVARPTPHGREKIAQFRQRMYEKNWPARWPRVRVLDGDLSGWPAAPR
jgi:hypothetical protein